MLQDLSTLFRIAHVGSRERQILADAYAVLSSKKLLQQRSPSLFLGDQHHNPFPLPDETERAPEVTPTATEPVALRPVPPVCPRCHTSMKWYRSTLIDETAKIIEHRFSCSTCGRIAFVEADAS